MTVKTRIAPSPTGDPHVGTAYIALFNYLFAKKHNGNFILRIEDTDRVRSAHEYEQAIMDSLRWLGIQWDEGPDVGGPSSPYRQSERKEIYVQHVKTLLDVGAAYRCFCSAQRLAEMREQQKKENKGSKYDGHCRNLSSQTVHKNLQKGIPYVVRLKMPLEGDSVFTDRLRGEIRYPNYQMDDQILLKSDGFPTYHLANVVDDHLMGITHVIRAEEWIPSTPKHVQLYKAFGWELPEFIHMPLLRNKDKSKISKRKNPTSILYYRQIGILPEAMINFLALMGYSYGEDREKFSLNELLANFDIDRVSLGEPVFDVEKLFWLNGLYLRELSHHELCNRLLQEVYRPEYIMKIVPLLRERIRTLHDFVPATLYFFSPFLNYDPRDLLPKNTSASELQDILSAVSEQLDGLKNWNHLSIERTMRDYCRRTGVKPRKFFMAIRVAVTGRKASPPLFETMEVIGKPLCQQRLRDALNILERLKKENQSE